MNMLVHANDLVHYATRYDATTFLWCLGGHSIPWIWRTRNDVAQHATCLGCITRGAPTYLEVMGWLADRGYPETLA